MASSPSTEYEFTATTSPSAAVGLSVADYERHTFKLSAIGALLKSQDMKTVQIKRSDVGEAEEPIAILFPSQSELDNFVDSVLVRNKTSTPNNKIEVSYGEVQDLTHRDAEALLVVTHEELRAEETSLQDYSEELHNILSNMTR